MRGSISLRAVLVLSVAMAILGLAAGPANADPLYWDNAFSAPLGSWDEGITSNWSATLGGGGLYDDSAWIGGSDAHFEGTAGVVPLSGTILSVNSIGFDTDGYTLGNAVNNGTIALTGAGGNITTGAGTDTIKSVIDGAVGLTKLGAGTLTLSGTNIYTGGTTISNGTLQFTKLVSMPATGAVAVNTDTTLAVNVGGTGEWATGTSGNGTIGGLLAGQGGQSGGTVSYTGDVTLGLQVTGTQTYSGNIVDVGDSLRLSKSGSGTLTLSGTNTYSGGTTISGGTISAANNSALGTGPITFTANGTLGAAYLSGGYTLANSVTVNPGVIATFNPGNQYQKLTITGPLAGSGTVYWATGAGGAAGLQTFSSASNTFTGTISVNSIGNGAGRLTVNSLPDSANPIRLTGTSNPSIFALGAGTATSLLFNSRQIELYGTTQGGTIQNNNATASNTITINTDLLVSTAGAKTLTLGGSNTGNNTFGGQIANSTSPAAVISLTKADAGKWILSGDNAYTGGTTVTAGTLNATVANALGTGPVTVTGGTLNANAANVMSTGSVTVTGGTLVIGAADAMADTAALRLPSATAKNLTMNFNDTVGSLFLAGLQQPNNTYTSSGAGSAWMNTGTGILTVGSAATQPLYWDLDLDAGAGGTGSTTPAGTWDAGTPNWNAVSDGTGSTSAWTQGRTAAFAAGTDATGPYTVTVDGTRDIGGLTFEEGTVTISPGTAGELRMMGDSLAYVNTGLIATVATPITQDAARSFTKGGPGTLILSAANGYTGTTTVNQGTLQLSHADAISASSGLVLTGGSVVIDSGVAVNLTSLTFNTGTARTVTGGTLAFASGGSISNSDNRIDCTITSAITGSPAVNTKDYGIGNQYKGLIFAPSSGTQTLGAVLNPDNTGVTDAGGIATDKAGITLAGSTTGNSVASISYVGGDQYGTVYKQGTSTWTTGNITNGTLAISGGTLVVNGTITMTYNGLQMSGSGVLSGNATVFKNDRRSANDFVSGTGIAPGSSVGTISFDWGTAGTPAAGQWTTAFRAGSIYQWEVGASNATDVVNVVDGNLIVAGFTLKILDAGGDPLATDQLPVFTYGTLNSKNLSLGSVVFDTTALSGWTIGTLALTDNGTGTIYLTGLSKGTPGDVDGNGVVDAADYIIIKQNFGMTGTAARTDGDLSGDHDVNWTDLQMLMTALAATTPEQTPEPATLGLLAIGAMGLLKRRRK